MDQKIFFKQKNKIFEKIKIFEKKNKILEKNIFGKKTSKIFFGPKKYIIPIGFFLSQSPGQGESF